MAYEFTPFDPEKARIIAESNTAREKLFSDREREIIDSGRTAVEQTDGAISEVARIRANDWANRPWFNERRASVNLQFTIGAVEPPQTPEA